MRREEALGDFLKKGDEMLTAREPLFWERLFVRKAEIVSRFRESLTRLERRCGACAKECRYIYCSLLRVDLLKSRYLTLIQAVGEDYALDPDPVEELLDLGDFFDELEAVRVDLIHGLPQYNGKVGAGDVQKLTAERAV